MVRESGAEDAVTIFHSCQRLLCGLEATEPFRVVNYITLLAHGARIRVRGRIQAMEERRLPEAVEALIGAERIERMGRDRFEQVLPDILRKPVR